MPNPDTLMAEARNAREAGRPEQAHALYAEAAPTETVGGSFFLETWRYEKVLA